MWHSQINTPTYFSMSSNQHSIYVIPFLPTSLLVCSFKTMEEKKREQTRSKESCEQASEDYWHYNEVVTANIDRGWLRCDSLVNDLRLLLVSGLE